MAFKIAVDAGHYLYTSGNKISKQLDPNETREWVLNDRVARHFIEAAKQYEGVETLRVDDITGNTEVSLSGRCQRANNWGTDMYLSAHHNAGVNLGSGGGIVAFSYKHGTKAAEYRDEIYDACIAAGGLKGNRAIPKTVANFYVLRYTNAPAVLMEYGFMDSTTDVPVILQEEYSKKMAYATMEGIAKAAGLRKKNGDYKEPVNNEYTLNQFVRDVQSACGAAVDGVAGKETISKTVTLSANKNRTHGSVKPVQKRLAQLGYSCVGEPDGVAGPKFRQAVMTFQKDNGCWADGEITAKNKTWRKLLGMS